ncbi:hypothetical protein ACFQY5_18795 [Paeniroseomonas aquatica]|uniref:hypothetical protein n=1 Tax=Paeniroseomonas aquatica TaxID=373043 RepID=UPI00360F2A85
MVRIVQECWGRFLDRFGICSTRAADTGSPEALGAISIPFEHPDVRVIVDTMFLEGTLQPVTIEGSPTGMPAWVKVGLVEDPGTLGDLVREGIKKIAEDLPGMDRPTAIGLTSRAVWERLASGSTV